MRIILAIIVFLHLLSGPVFAQTIPGVDYLGGTKYESVMLSTHPAGWAAGIFLRTFGDAKRTIEKMCQSGKFREIVIHTEPFDSSHTYDIAKSKKRVLEDFKWLQSLAVKYPGTKILGSPYCEHNHPTSKISPLFAELRDAAPNVILVNSIWKGGRVPGVITEIHLETSKNISPPPGEYIVSFDGFGGDGSGDFPDADIETLIRRYATARQFRLWNFRFNGKYGNKDKTPLASRKYWPDENYILAHTKMIKYRAGTKTWPNTAVFKPMADDHGDPAPTKDNKAMTILPGKNLGSVKVYDSGGRHIDTMTAPKVNPEHKGTPKGIRYYSGKYAYQIADRAVKNTGSPLIKIHSMPPTDGYLRSSIFQ